MSERINIHPGEILLEEFLKPMGLSQNKLAIELRVPAHRINEIVHGKRGVTADTALRFSKFFGVTPGFWMGLQDEFELREARYKLEKELKFIHRCELIPAHA